MFKTEKCGPQTRLKRGCSIQKLNLYFYSENHLFSPNEKKTECKKSYVEQVLLDILLAFLARTTRRKNAKCSFSFVLIC